MTIFSLFMAKNTLSYGKEYPFILQRVFFTIQSKRWSHIAGLGHPAETVFQQELVAVYPEYGTKKSAVWQLCGCQVVN